MKFKIGENVIVGKFPNETDGVHWNHDMENFIGKLGTIIFYNERTPKAYNKKYYVIKFDTTTWCYPESALTSLRENKLKRIIGNEIS